MRSCCETHAKISDITDTAGPTPASLQCYNGTHTIDLVLHMDTGHLLPMPSAPPLSTAPPTAVHTHSRHPVLRHTGGQRLRAWEPSCLHVGLLLGTDEGIETSCILLPALYSCQAARSRTAALQTGPCRQKQGKEKSLSRICSMRRRADAQADKRAGPHRSQDPSPRSLCGSESNARTVSQCWVHPVHACVRQSP